MTRDRTVNCPTCQATPGQPCITRSGGVAAKPHTKRNPDYAPSWCRRAADARAAAQAPGPSVPTGVHPATYSEIKGAWGTVTGWRFTCPTCLATSHIYQKECTAKLIANEHNCTGKVTA